MQKTRIARKTIERRDGLLGTNVIIANYIETDDVENIPVDILLSCGSQVAHQIKAVIVIYDDDPNHDNMCENSMCHCKYRREQREAQNVE